MENKEEEKLSKDNSSDTEIPGQEDPVSATPQSAETQDSGVLGTARTLATIGAIGAPVSLIIGGVLLSTIAVICSIVALVKLSRVSGSVEPNSQMITKSIRLTAITGLCVGCGALLLNVIGIMLMMPVLMEAMASGDYTSILGSNVQGISDVSSSDSNPWG